MHDTDMTPFELSLASRLRAHSDIQVAPANALSIARETLATERRDGLEAAFASFRGPIRLAIVFALASALLLGAWFVGSRLQAPQLVVAPSPSVGPPSLPDTLRSEWLADVEAFAAISLPGPRPRLVVADDGATMHLVTEAGVEVLGSRVNDAGPGEFAISTEAAGLGCSAGDSGTYRSTTSADGATLVIETIEDACSNRGRILARTWWRSFDRRSDGGRGLVAAFDPAFLITLPKGGYVGKVYTDAVEAVDNASGIALFAGKDPWGLSEPCSASGGAPLQLAPGADAFVAYMRTLPGFTVATNELQIDGHRAVHLSITTSAGIDCPGGVVIEWIAKADAPGGVTWHLGPGDPDSMYVVETPAATYLLQYLGPNVTTLDEVGVLSTVRFVESLAAGP